MWKVICLFAIGLAAVSTTLLYKQYHPASESLLVPAGDAQNADVQKSLAALDRKVRSLDAELQALRDSSVDARVAGDDAQDTAELQAGPRGDRLRFGEPRTPDEIAAMREEMQNREAERIRAAGLTPERMKSIVRRMEELRVAALQAQYEAQRTGQPASNLDVEQSLRSELGDDEYERYLKAAGRTTEVRVAEVLATSAAERAGLRAGDEILSYAGKRVFDTRDLNALANQGTLAGQVTVEVRRNGQTLQIAVPAGPLGVTSAGGGPRGDGPGGRLGGGGPGGFRPPGPGAGG